MKTVFDVLNLWLFLLKIRTYCTNTAKVQTRDACLGAEGKFQLQPPRTIYLLSGFGAGEVLWNTAKNFISCQIQIKYVVRHPEMRFLIKFRCKVPRVKSFKFFNQTQKYVVKRAAKAGNCTRLQMAVFHWLNIILCTRSLSTKKARQKLSWNMWIYSYLKVKKKDCLITGITNYMQYILKSELWQGPHFYGYGRQYKNRWEDDIIQVCSYYINSVSICNNWLCSTAICIDVLRIHIKSV